jgi:osmotically-inducible protein OsmY
MISDMEQLAAKTLPRLGRHSVKENSCACCAALSVTWLAGDAGYELPPLRQALIHTSRSMCRSHSAWGIALILTGALSGCAVFNTYEKCGIYGCPGDAKITADIETQFSRRLDLEPNAITVQTLDHVVYLYGLVSSSLEIYTAESIVRKDPDVTGVVNSMVAQTR